jgi:hypothetical protein
VLDCDLQLYITKAVDKIEVAFCASSGNVGLRGESSKRITALLNIS